MGYEGGFRKVVRWNNDVVSLRNVRVFLLLHSYLGHDNMLRLVVILSRRVAVIIIALTHVREIKQRTSKKNSLLKRNAEKE